MPSYFDKAGSCTLLPVVLLILRRMFAACGAAGGAAAGAAGGFDGGTLGGAAGGAVVGAAGEGLLEVLWMMLRAGLLVVLLVVAWVVLLAAETVSLSARAVMTHHPPTCCKARLEIQALFLPDVRLHGDT